jgi:hypothetical protein
MQGDELFGAEESDEDEDDDEFGDEVAVAKSGLTPDDFFSLLALGKEFEEDDTVEQDLDAEADPINQVRGL